MNRRNLRRNYRKHRNNKRRQDYQNYQDYQKRTDLIPPLPPSYAPNIIPHYCPHPMPENAATNILPQYLRHYIYIWTEPDREFWMYPVQIDGNTIRGYIWDNCSWIYSYIPINQISGFY